MGKPGKNSPKKPRFFCENCGAEVNRNARNCPKCGRSFASVLCPACGFSGEEALFKGGCPICGYSAALNEGQDRTSAGSRFGFTSANNTESVKPAGVLPVWVYILTSAAFIAVLAALYFSFFK